MTFRSFFLSLAFVLVLASGASAGVVADYGADFHGTIPKDGWTYQWNNGPIGTQSKYQDLVWWEYGGRYIATPQVYPDESSPAGYVALSKGGNSHPGSSASEGDPEVYAIAGYEVQPGQAGKGSITKSSITVPNTGKGSDGVVVQIYVNDTLKDTIQATGTTDSFDLSLGTLAVGDRVYVAVGPGASSGYDAFQISYQITVDR
ncbi:MAG: hypothetical protein NTV93_15440 [Verrucomicrobia bacterium]|nr:hypothetical protein [Verrucomicrobiota bacterium]